MKFTVTALGSTPGGEADAALRITNYLMGTTPAANRPMVGAFEPDSVAVGAATIGAYYQSGGDGVYKSSEMEGDGWWGGVGAERMGLTGVVDGEDLRSLLEGRHYETGERLITARGSAGRQGLKRGRHTRKIDGVPVWGLRDAAAQFDVAPADVDELVSGFPASLFVVDGQSRRWLTAAGVDALGEELDHVDASQAVEALQHLDTDSTTTVAEAARHLGVSEEYVRRALSEWTRHQDAIEAAAGGKRMPHKKACLRGSKSENRWEIRVGDLVEFAGRRVPPSVRQAYDVVGTVEKSVALLTMLSDAETRKRCISALLAANSVGMGWLDQQASRGRRKGSSVGSEGFVWASFMHGTSRANDPHPHIHNVVMNFIEDPFGGRRAVDARFLYSEAKSASALATAELRWVLTSTFPGVRWVQHRLNGVWELEGISPELIQEFSTRRSEIEEAAAALTKGDGTLPTRAELQAISQATRSAKKVAYAAEVLADWFDRASRHGFDPATVLAMGRREADIASKLTEVERQRLFTFLADAAEGVCNEESTFTRGDVLAAINRWAPQGTLRPLPAATVLELAEDFLSTQLAIPVEHDQSLITRSDGRPAGSIVKEERWTTPSMVVLQARIVQQWGSGIAAAYLADISVAQLRSTAEEMGLSNEQRRLVEVWTRSGDQFQAAIGQPGTGKTFTMRAANAIWEANGYQVIGAAVKGTAAQHLARETGIRSETVAYLLKSDAEGVLQADSRTVIVVDEATTLSDRDLWALMDICRRSGAAFRMIGDPAQQQSVNAGGMWEHMVTTYYSRTPELTEQRRLQNPDEIESARLLRAGLVDEAFDSMLAAGSIEQAPDPDESELLALVGWLDRIQRGVNAPMIDRRNAARVRLNWIAQAIRVKLGDVEGVRRYGDRQIGVGDHVIATQPNRDLFPRGDPGSYVSNGSTGIVTAADDDGVSISFDGLGSIQVPAAAVMAHLDLGYALTAYSVQGLTLPESEAVVRMGEDIHGLYVMMTRGKGSNRLIATQPIPGESHGTEDRPDRLPVVDVADSVVDAKQQPALVADPDLELLTTSQFAHANDEDSPLNQRRKGADIARVRRQARVHPPGIVRDLFPARPSSPWLARKWEATIGDLAEYRYKQSVPLREDTTGVEILIGPEPAQGSEHHDAWAEIKARLLATGKAVVLRNLEDSLSESLAHILAADPAIQEELASPVVLSRSRWLEGFLGDHLCRGSFNSDTNYERLAPWVSEVDQLLGSDNPQVNSRAREALNRCPLDLQPTHSPTRSFAL